VDGQQLIHSYNWSILTFSKFPSLWVSGYCVLENHSYCVIAFSKDFSVVYPCWRQTDDIKIGLLAFPTHPNPCKPSICHALYFKNIALNTVNHQKFQSNKKIKPTLLQIERHVTWKSQPLMTDEINILINCSTSYLPWLLIKITSSFISSQFLTCHGTVKNNNNKSINK
jgi:hypothetical protein